MPTCDTTTNPQVQELESGACWWYEEHLLESVPEEQVPEELLHPTPPGMFGMLHHGQLLHIVDTVEDST